MGDDDTVDENQNRARNEGADRNTLDVYKRQVQHSVKSFASKVAFAMYGGEELSYAEVGTRVKHVQDLLIGAGLKAGDKVALLSSNMPNWCVSYLAVTSAGMVAVPILPDFSTEELEMIIAHSEAKALMVSDKLFAKLAKSTIESLHIVIRTKNLGVIASRPAAEKGAVGIPNPEDVYKRQVMNYKRRNNLYIHVLLTDTETDARSRGTALFQIDGNFHRQYVFYSHCKGK